MHILLSLFIGLGRKKCRDDDWIEHQDTFDQILANLNAQTVSCQKEDTSGSTKALLDTATNSKRLLYDVALVRQAPAVTLLYVILQIQEVSKEQGPVSTEVRGLGLCAWEEEKKTRHRERGKCMRHDTYGGALILCLTTENELALCSLLVSQEQVLL